MPIDTHFPDTPSGNNEDLANEATADALLEAVYADLDFRGGELLDANDAPATLDADDWVTKGGWLSLAKKVGAEKVLFVGENPVIVFARDRTA